MKTEEMLSIILDRFDLGDGNHKGSVSISSCEFKQILDNRNFLIDCVDIHKMLAKDLIEAQTDGVIDGCLDDILIKYITEFKNLHGIQEDQAEWLH